MRVFFKVLLFPISLILTIVVPISEFLIIKLAVLLNIASGILFLGALLGFLQYFFGWPMGGAGNTQNLISAIVAVVFSFLLSPFGLPTLAIWIVSRLAILNELIKSI